MFSINYFMTAFQPPKILLNKRNHERINELEKKKDWQLCFIKKTITMTSREFLSKFLSAFFLLCICIWNNFLKEQVNCVYCCTFWLKLVINNAPNVRKKTI